jgi:hypothetical protein
MKPKNTGKALDARKPVTIAVRVEVKINPDQARFRVMSLVPQLASSFTIIVHNTATDDNPNPIRQKYNRSVVSA